MKARFRTGIAIACVLLCMPATAADVVVVINKANTQAVDMALVEKIYTGEATAWSDGSTIFPIDQNDETVRSAFAKLIGKTAANLKSLWARLMFTGKTVPPKIVAGDAEVKAAVSANRAAIGYISAASVDDSVKVVK